MIQFGQAYFSIGLKPPTGEPSSWQSFMAFFEMVNLRDHFKACWLPPLWFVCKMSTIQNAWLFSLQYIVFFYSPVKMVIILQLIGWIPSWTNQPDVCAPPMLPTAPKFWGSLIYSMMQLLTAPTVSDLVSTGFRTCRYAEKNRPWTASAGTAFLEGG